jgi:exopolysaccharide biosynthesis protein
MKHFQPLLLIVLSMSLCLMGTACSKKKAVKAADPDLTHPTLQYVQVVPGIERATFSRTNSPLTYHVVKADLSSDKLQIAALEPNFRAPTSNGKSTIGEMLPEASSSTRQGVAAISGDYFANGMEGPWGVHIVGGHLLYSPQGRAALMVDPQGKVFIDHPVLTLQIQTQGQTEWKTIMDMNRTGNGEKTGLHLYANTKQVTTAPAKGGAIWIESELPLVGGIVSGRVTKVWTTDTAIPLPETGLVLACWTDEATTSSMSKDFPEGTMVSIRATLAKPATEAVGGGPQIVRDGKVSLDLAQDGIGAVEASYLKRLHPRAVVGIANGGSQIFFVMVQGRSEASLGMGLEDLATLMVGLGAENATMFDGGDSAALYVGNAYLAHGRGSPRGIVNGLGVFATVVAP